MDAVQFSRRRDFTTGLRMPVTGLSVALGSGVPLCPFGAVMMESIL